MEVLTLAFTYHPCDSYIASTAPQQIQHHHRPPCYNKDKKLKLVINFYTKKMQMGRM